MPRPSDRWQHLPPAYGSLTYRALDLFQAHRRLGLPETERFLPTLAAAHFTASRDTALRANAEGHHSAALGLARQCLEASTIIEVGFLPAESASKLLAAWQESRIQQGDLRRALERDLWSKLPDAPWGISWTRHMTSLAKTLQPYSHCSPELVQWTLARQKPPAATPDGLMIAAIGKGAFDADKAERLALLLTVFLWNLLVCMEHVEGLDDGASDALASISAQLRETKWLDAGEEWHDQLVPHVWFKEASAQPRA